jgi:hypothetical protein
MNINDPLYHELVSKKQELLAAISGSPLDGESAFQAWIAKLELLQVAKAMKSLEATLPF